MTYRVNAPNKSIVSITCKYGSFTYHHGDIMYDDRLPSLFPTIFEKISDGIPTFIAQQLVEQTQVEPTPIIDTKNEELDIIENVQGTLVFPNEELQSVERLFESILPKQLQISTLPIVEEVQPIIKKRGRPAKGK